MSLIDVIGLGADGPSALRPELAERIHRADFLAAAFPWPRIWEKLNMATTTVPVTCLRPLAGID